MNGKDKRGADYLTVYCFARVEQFIEDYARSHELLTSQLTQRVGELLCAQAGGKILGNVDHLSAVSGAGGGRRNGKAGAEVALDERTSGGTLQEEVRAGIPYKGYKYNGTHWTQRPEYKKKMMKQIRIMHKLQRAVIREMKRGK